jgi:hypothetical protein
MVNSNIIPFQKLEIFIKLGMTNCPSVVRYSRHCCTAFRLVRTGAAVMCPVLFYPDGGVKKILPKLINSI